MSELSEALLEAHVAHELSKWRGDSAAARVELHVSEWFRWLGDVKINDVVTREQILGVIQRYVIELHVSGGITELAGEMARLVLSSKAAEGLRVGNVIGNELYEEFADAILGLDKVRRELIGIVVHSDAFLNTVARVVAHAVSGVLFARAGADHAAHGKKLLDVLGGLRARYAPQLERRVAELVTVRLEQHHARVADFCQEHVDAVLDAETLRAVVDEVWNALAQMHLSEAFSFVGASQLEDFVVIVYEFWLRFRETEFFRRILAELVDYFFIKYGDETVVAWIEDMGVSQEMVSAELKASLMPLLEHAHTTGFLEQLIRMELSAFYRSPSCAKILNALPSP